MTSPQTVAGSLTFLLGKLGSAATARFAERLAVLGIRPRHCAVLELAGSAPMSQLDLATRIGVTPSVVVDMLDELAALDAIKRVPQAGDRRRRIIELTPGGVIDKLMDYDEYINSDAVQKQRDEMYSLA